jgi:hypothetical protein
MAEDAYRLGQSGIAALLQASRDARLRALQAASDLQNTLVDLERGDGRTAAMMRPSGALLIVAAAGVLAIGGCGQAGPEEIQTETVVPVTVAPATTGAMNHRRSGDAQFDAERLQSLAKQRL